MKLRVTRRAFRDLQEISDYIRAHNPGAAGRVRAAIQQSLDILPHFPKIGRRQSESGVRRLVTRRYPYLVYYQVDESAGEVVVLTIQHPARDREFENG